MWIWDSCTDQVNRFVKQANGKKAFKEKHVA